MVREDRKRGKMTVFKRRKWPIAKADPVVFLSLVNAPVYVPFANFLIVEFKII